MVIAAKTLDELDELLQYKDGVRLLYDRREVLCDIQVRRGNAMALVAELLRLAPELVAGCREAQRLQTEIDG